MAENIFVSKPGWLNDNVINDLKEIIINCPNPYSEEEQINIPFDGPFDFKRSKARWAINMLTKYGVPYETYEEYHNRIKSKSEKISNE